MWETYALELKEYGDLEIRNKYQFFLLSAFHRLNGKIFPP